MKVLLLSPSPPPFGGIARWTETVIEFCLNNDIQLIHVDTGNRTKDVVNRNFFQRFVLQFFRIIQIRHEIKRILKSDSVDVAHITTSGNYSVLRDWILSKLFQKYNISYVYHLHFGKYKQLKEENNIRYKLINKVIEKSKITIAMDPVTYETLEANDVARFVPNPIEEIDVSDAEENSVVFLGYVVKNKGIEELLSAWKTCHSIYKDWKLKIVGPFDAEYKKILDSICNDDSVEYFGELEHDQAIGILSKGRIMVLPSYSEGFPYSICEAMFCGKAIVASRVGAVPFMLSENCGIVCEPKNVDSLCTELSKLMGDIHRQQELGSNAAKRARTLFEKNVVMKQYLELWDFCKKS